MQRCRTVGSWRLPVSGAMASLSCSTSSPFTPKRVHPIKIKPLNTKFPNIPTNSTFKTIKIKSTNSITSIAEEEDPKIDEESIGIDNLHRFIQLNLGSWVGSFNQFDAHGKLLHRVTTKLSASSYGEDQLISLIQTSEAQSTAYSSIWQCELCWLPVLKDQHSKSGKLIKFSVLSVSKLRWAKAVWNNVNRPSHCFITMLALYVSVLIPCQLSRLYIKQPPSTTSVSDHMEEAEWAEYKIKESNMFTVDKYQQLGFFPNKKAFALRYQTTGMLETVLRQGVLGEDDIGEESPRNLKLPSSRPSIVCENCLYSIENDMRARAFHIIDPKGVLDMLLVFLEERGKRSDSPPILSETMNGINRLQPFLGHWKGNSITKRSGVYGATIAEHHTTASLEIDENGLLMQDITATTISGGVTTNVRWTGTMSDNLITFDKGFQLTLLPGGMYMGCPCNLAESVAESKSFHLEFCWLESSGKRQRLIRTFDVEGLAVSSTYFFETRS
ncbi:hypothetical protein KSS87_022596 [Heliosperma pusillum]|nr:hypothetical protein KSS87_022596 [Heliosperma pusillum]